jgi:aminopeptidase C
MIKKVLLSVLAAGAMYPAAAQFEFTTVKELPISSVKNQNRSSTCWCFSTLSYFESELMRLGKGEMDFSEAFVVNKTMMDRAEKAVRTHGDVSFSPGGFAYDVAYCWKHYGIIPQEAMPAMGTLYGDSLPNNNELDKIAESYVTAIAKSEAKKLSPLWKQGLQSIYDTYLGKCPEKFTYKGKEYTPQSYAASLGLNMDDYVSITSFTHHPFYERMVIEVQDNWRWDLAYNVPMDEMMKIIDNAVNKGYTLAWGADVSELGFSRNGIGQLPDVKSAEFSGSDQARWTGLTSDWSKREFLTSKPLPEIKATQALRQEGYDNWETTDDHGMLIYGIAKDQNGKEYYMAKNSWGTDNQYKGTWYFTKTFVAMKTIDVMVHKDAIPADIAKKLNININIKK